MKGDQGGRERGWGRERVKRKGMEEEGEQKELLTAFYKEEGRGTKMLEGQKFKQKGRSGSN